MKLKQEKQHEIVGLDSTAMRVDASNLAMLIEIVSTRLYSDPIGSTVRLV